METIAKIPLKNKADSIFLHLFHITSVFKKHLFYNLFNPLQI